MHITVINDDPIRFESIVLALASTNAQIQSIHLNRIVVNPACLSNTDLVIVDLDYSNLYEKCTFIRQNTSKPLMILSARDDQLTVSSLLNSGADDFLVKPFQNNVLIAHINSLLKRSAPNLMPLSV